MDFKKRDEEITFFEKLIEYNKEDLQENIDYITHNKGNKKAIAYSMRNQFKELGIVEACYKMEYDKAKIYFYHASKIQEWFYINYNNSEHNIPSGEVTTYSFETLYYAILSGCKEQIRCMASYLGSFLEEEKEECNLVNTLLGYSLKYIVLNDIKKGMEYIKQLEENKAKRGMKQYVEGHGRAFRGLIQRDEVEFNKGLEFMLKHHIVRMKRDGRKIEQYFAYDSVALAMLAKEQGINITVKHELLPEKYLEKTDIDYSAVEVILR